MECCNCGYCPLFPSEFPLLVRAVDEEGDVICEYHDEGLDFCSRACAVEYAKKALAQKDISHPRASHYDIAVGEGGLLHDIGKGLL